MRRKGFSTVYFWGSCLFGHTNDDLRLSSSKTTLYERGWGKKRRERVRVMDWSLFALRASSVYHIAWPLKRDLSKAKQSTLGINQNPHIVGIYSTSFEEKSLSAVYHDWHFRNICKDESCTVYSRSVLGRLVYSTVHTCSTYRAIYIVDRPSTVDFKVRSLAPPKNVQNLATSISFSYKRPADRFRFKIDFLAF
jgi:hypothetical protein